MPLASRLLLALLLALAPFCRADTRAHENAALLHAIVIVEDARGRTGAAGEVSPFQMLPGTRADRLREFAAKGETAPSDRMLAAAHLEWLRGGLRRAGVAPLPFNLALCWNAGLAAVVTGRAPVSSYRYAVRVVAIMEDSRP